MLDEIMIERLSAARDREMSLRSLGGMYDPVDYRKTDKSTKLLIPGVTDAFGNKLLKEEIENDHL